MGANAVSYHYFRIEHSTFKSPNTSVPVVLPDLSKRATWAVFGQVNDFHRWDGWSPWAKMDPAMKTTYSGAAAGEGASYAWVGNSQVGEGRMTITESRPSDHIVVRLEFVKPMAATNTATFTFKPDAGGTDVTWAMDGNNGFMGKAFSVFMNMDKMLGAYFEQGLGQMKVAAEHS